jgi:hypothetical protein
VSREVIVAWDGIEDGSRREERIASLDQLEAVLGTIELMSMQSGYIYQIDLRLAQISVGDPILIQFLVGHPERSSLLWHEDGVTMLAVQSQRNRLRESLSCKRFGHNEYVDPQFTMIDYAAVRDILSLYLLLDRRPDTVNWVEAEQDLEAYLPCAQLLKRRPP